MGKVSKALHKMASESPAEPAIKPQSEPEAFPAAEESLAENSSTVQVSEPSSPQQTKPAASISTIAVNKNWDERLISSIERFSGVAENIKKLRTKILHPESGKPIRSLMVTSSSAQEGKSFICANLGISFAQSMERHALMVDCDLRRPTLKNLFGIDTDKGLADYLNTGEQLPGLIKPTGLDKLSILPAGMPPQNPSELLTSDKMSLILEEMTQRYDDRLILLDTPPFHAASETLVLSQHVDKVVIVVRWGKSGREDIKKMVDQIGRDKIIGVVFNAFEMNILDRKVQGLSYHNYYTDSYY